MALTSWSSSNYLSVASAVISSRPLMLAAWGYPTWNTSGIRTGIEVGQDGVSNHKRTLRGQSGPDPAAAERDTATAAAVSSAAMTEDAWNFMAAAFVSSTLREAYMGTTRTANTGSVSPNAPNATYVGADVSALNAWESDAALAEVQAWDLTGMTQANRESLVAKLAAGENPIAVDGESGQPWSGALVWYIPLTDTNDLADQVGTNDLTMTGTLTDFGSHPTIDSLAPDPATISREPADIAAQEQTDTTAHVRIDSVDTTSGNTSALWGHTSNLGTDVPATWEASATQVDASVTTNDLVAWASRSPNTTYYFAVVTTDSGSNKTQSAVLSITTAYAKPTSPTIVSKTSDTVTVSATDASSGAAAHQAFFRESAQALSALQFAGTIPAGETIQFEFTDLTAGTEYSFEFVAWDGVETASTARYSALTAVTATPGATIPIFAHHYKMLAVA